MSDKKLKVERVQTGVRLEKRMVKVLKALAEYLDITMGDLLEGIILHALEEMGWGAPAHFVHDIAHGIGQGSGFLEWLVTATLDGSPAPVAGGFLQIVPTHSFSTLPARLGTLLVAGGPGRLGNLRRFLVRGMILPQPGHRIRVRLKRRLQSQRRRRRER